MALLQWINWYKYASCCFNPFQISQQKNQLTYWLHQVSWGPCNFNKEVIVCPTLIDIMFRLFTVSGMKKGLLPP